MNMVYEVVDLFNEGLLNFPIRRQGWWGVCVNGDNRSELITYAKVCSLFPFFRNSTGTMFLKLCGIISDSV